MSEIAIRKLTPGPCETTRYEVSRDGQVLGFVCSMKKASWRNQGLVLIGLRGRSTKWHAYTCGVPYAASISCARTRRDAVRALDEATR